MGGRRDHLAEYGTEGIGGKKQADHRGSVVCGSCVWIEGKRFVGLLALLLAPSGVEKTQLQR